VVSTAAMNFGRQPGALETTVSMDYALVATNAPANGRGLDMEIRALSVDVLTGERSVLHFDSLNKAVPNAGPGADLLQQVIGGHIRFLMDSNNAVASVEGIKELMERVQGDAGSGAADQRRNWTSGILQRIFNADYFGQLVDTGLLPGSATRIGDTWTRQREIDVGLLGRVLLSTTNTLRGWQDHEGKKCARIDFKGTLGLKTGKAEGPFALLGLALQEGQVSGRAWFDPAARLPVETVLEQSCMVSFTRPNAGRRNNPQATNAGPPQVTFPWNQTISTSLAAVEQIAPAPSGN
jgi:hypothetical protein